LKKSVARLKECCDEIGRDISTIRISTQLWVDRMSEAEAIERALAYEDAGVSLAIVSLPRPLNVKHIKEYPELFASVWK
jgi:2-methylisocitrate lyase-like PEP mutase family enzyme